jgi:hypothetical protein
MQVMRIVFMVGTKALLDGKLGREAAREPTGTVSSQNSPGVNSALATRPRTVRGKPGHA